MKKISVRKNDVFLVSYPKSGSHWVQFIIGSFLSLPNNLEIDFLNKDEYVADIYSTPSEKIEAMISPRYLKCHEPFEQGLGKVIYLVRDPRSIAVSYYYFLQRNYTIAKDLPFADYFSGYLDGRYDSIGPWDQHVEGWVESGHEQLLVLKYEDLLENPMLEAEKIVQFLGFNTDHEMIKKALEASSFGAMREKEKVRNQFIHNRDTSIPFVRSGKKDEWREYFNEAETKRLNDQFGHMMEKMGYR